MTRKIFFGLICMTFAVFLITATSAEAGKPGCGDGTCGPKENVDNCPVDCGGTPSPYCGDGNCDDGEDEFNCSEDCGPSSACGDGICNAGEDCNSCPEDCNSESGGTCGACFKGKCDGICNSKKEGLDCSDCATITYCCGLDADGCDDEALCGSDCGLPISNPYCGDGNTDEGEECDGGGETATCDIDCTLAVCGDEYPNQTAGEACDDGGDTATCNFDCTLAVCGDGYPNQAAGEECDDGNTTPGDGCNEICQNEASALVPLNQFNIGDSIGEGEAANGSIGSAHHDLVWSTGYGLTDIVYSLNERFEDLDGTTYYENNFDRDSIFNHAESGAVMAGFLTQVNDVVATASQTPSGETGMVTILMGNNDVCAGSLSGMTLPGSFEDQYRYGLNKLASSDETKFAEIHVSGIPAIYWLWVAKKDSSGCRLIWWLGGVCQALLQNPSDDCESTASRDDPDNIYPGDGLNCQRRKEFHRRIKDVYNPILRDVLQEYIDNGSLPNAQYVDIFDVKFEASHVNNGDCFHPSTEGHAFLANEEWCRSSWGLNDPICNP